MYPTALEAKQLREENHLQLVLDLIETKARSGEHTLRVWFPTLKDTENKLIALGYKVESDIGITDWNISW